jgi:hypothetical protein
VNELLLQKASFYVCGDAANMAREVNAVLVQLIAEGRGVTEQKAEEVVKMMRSTNQYQVRFLRVTPHLPPGKLSPLILTHWITGGRLVLDSRQKDWRVH